MNSAPSMSSELQEASKKLKAKDLKVQFEGMRQVMTLYMQGENCISAQSGCVAVSHEDNASMHRFANILNLEYAAETGTIPAVVEGIVSLFQKTNNLIKALAVKQAGYFVSDSTAETLVPIIVEGAKSQDPYIRKTAALAILKIHHRSERAIDKYNLAPVLQELLMDKNPSVTANAVAAISEISRSRNTPFVEMSVQLVKHLLTMMKDAHEWAQVQILEFVSRLNVPLSVDDAASILKELSTRLVQANPAITMAAIRCCFRLKLAIEDPEFLMRLFRKLVTMLSNGKEIQYVVLRSICVVKQKYNDLFVADVENFFCKYDDEIYIKLAKIDIILMLTTTKNMGVVLKELKNYASRPDEDEKFVQKSIRAIGRLALFFNDMAETCVDHLVTLMRTRVSAVVQECIIVSVNLLRKFPDLCDIIISAVCQVCNVELDHRAKAAMVWIFGEYSEKIKGAADFISSSFLENFVEESTEVQLAILTAIVKLFVKSYPQIEPTTRDMLKTVLSLAISGVDNPDLNDRAYMYLWLLKDCPQKACEIVQTLSEETVFDIPNLGIFEPKLVEALVPQIGTLAVLYGKFPGEFVPSARARCLHQPPEPTRPAPPPAPPKMIKLEMQEADVEQSFESQSKEEEENMEPNTA